MLAASYVAERGLVVWDGRDPAVRRVLALAERKGVPVHVLGGPMKKPTVKRGREPEGPNPRRGLPD